MSHQKDQRASEIRWEPSTRIEMQYFNRIQVLKLHIRKQNEQIEEFKDWQRQKIKVAIKETETYEHQRRQIKKLVDEVHKLKVQISELISQRVNELK